MTERAAPGVIAGCLGLVLAVLAMTTETPWLAGAAGACALVAGLFTLGLADRLSRSQEAAHAAVDRADRAEADSEVMAARAAVFEAKARRVVTPAPAPTPAPAMAGVEDRGGPSSDLTRITDVETGLFDATFFAVALDKRVATARRGLRPLAVALLEPVTEVTSDQPLPAIDREVAASVVETLRDSDIACRLTGDRLAVILEDTPENGAVWTIERVRRRLAESPRPVTLRAGVACYPAHAFDADRLLRAADDALSAARDWPRDRIEVAPLPDDLD